MPLSNLFRSAAGTCPFCHQRAGILSREHQGCRRTYQAGWNEMVHLAADVARSHEFHANSLQVSLAEIAKLKPRWDVHLSSYDDQLGCAGESLSSVLGE